jgi:hypothetical protein
MYEAKFARTRLEDTSIIACFEVAQGAHFAVDNDKRTGM